MKPITYLIIIACAVLLVGCAANTPPAELINARQSYQHASEGQASQLAPAELHKAQAALATAEKSFQDDPESFRTRDLAYVADRKAKMAEALAATVAENATTARANKEYQSTQTTIMNNTKEDLATQTAIAKNAKDDLATQTQISRNTKADLATQTQIVKNTREDLATQTAITNNTKADLAASERNGALKTEQLASEQKARLAAEKREADELVAELDALLAAPPRSRAAGTISISSSSRRTTRARRRGPTARGRAARPG